MISFALKEVAVLYALGGTCEHAGCATEADQTVTS